MGGVNKKLDSIGKAAKTAAKIATAAFAAVKIGDFMKDAVSTYADFDQAMANTAATAGASAEDYQKLEAAALEMGKKTTKTATEASEALGYMALAGWDVETSISALEPVLRLSEATSMDLATCSDLVTDSMSALGLTVDELSGYLDVACKANNKSNQSAQELMEAYIGCGGVMNNLGVDVEDSATALGVLANRGIKGSEAGNKLNTVMINLTSGSGQAGAMMEKLGISAFDSEGKFIGLQKTLELVNNATKDLSEEERNAALAAIGGKTQIDTLNDLMAGLNTTTEDGRTEWQALSDELHNADGAMMEMAGKVTDTLPGAMSRFQSAVDDAKIRICKIFAPMAKDAIGAIADHIPYMTEGITDFISGLSGRAIPSISSFKDKSIALFHRVRPVLKDIGSKGAEAFRFLAETGKTAFQNIQAKIGENKPVIDKVIAVVLDLKDKFFQAFEKAKPTISFIATQALPQVVTAAMKLVGAASTVYQKLNEWGMIKPIVMGIAGAIAAVKMINFAKNTLNTVKAVKALVTVFATQKKAMLVNLALKIKDKAETLYLHALYAKDAIIKGASTAATWAQTAAMTAWNAICTVGAAVTTALGAAFTFLTSPIGLVILAIAAIIAIGVLLYKNWDTVKEKAGQLKEWITGKFNELKENISKAVQAFADKFPAAFAFISSVFNSWHQTAVNVISGVKQVFQGIIQFFTGVFTGDWSKALDGLKNIFSGAFKALSSLAMAPLNALKGVVTGAFNAIDTAIGGKLTNIRDAFQSKIEAAKQVVSDGLTAIKNFFSGLSLKLPDIKLPHFSISGSFSLSPPSIPKINVEWYKDGGILTRPTIFGANNGSLLGGGEAGREAVLPLSELWRNMRSVVAGVVGSAIAQPSADGNGIGMFDRVNQLVNGGPAGKSEGGSVTKELYSTISNNAVNKTTESDCSDNSSKVVFSPQITIQGNADRKDIESAMKLSQQEFDQMYAEHERQRGRTAFAT